MITKKKESKKLNKLLLLSNSNYEILILKSMNYLHETIPVQLNLELSRAKNK